MAPARMERHVERGIGRARRVDDELAAVVEARQIDAEMRQADAPSASIWCARSRTALALSNELALHGDFAATSAT